MPGVAGAAPVMEEDEERVAVGGGGFGDGEVDAGLGGDGESVGLHGCGLGMGIVGDCVERSVKMRHEEGWRAIFMLQLKRRGLIPW